MRRVLLQVVNVVMRRCSSGTYSVRRFNAEEQLFYPSTKEAQAANSNRGENEMEMETISRMPAPKLRLERSCVLSNQRMDFVPFHERGSGSGDNCKILCIDHKGRTAVLYDTASGLLHPVPGLRGRKGANPISFSMIDKEPHDPARTDALYVMARWHGCYDFFNFEALMYSGPSNHRKLWRWHDVPSPPVPMDTSLVVCHALIHNGDHPHPVLIVSSAEETIRVGTYRFYTSNNVWRKAGGWTLPFLGRAQHVPELDNLCFGVARRWPYHLCAVDVCSPLGLDTVHAPPLAYTWEDLSVARGWEMMHCSMVYLGGGRFCIAKIFEYCTHHDWEGMGAVISGLEVLRHGGEPSKLIMVKHKSKFYKFVRDEIQCIL